MTNTTLRKMAQASRVRSGGNGEFSTRRHVQRERSKIRLTNKNYYSEKANLRYISVSQYKDFFGTLEDTGCEACAMAKLLGEYTEEPTTAKLVGSYVDSYFEGTLDNFKERNPSIFKKDGTLKADYIQAEEIIKRIERDTKLMQYLSGEKQVIMSAKLFDADWKIKMDSFIRGKAIVDLKVVDEIYKPHFVKDLGKLSFIQARGYDFQLAVYQRVVELVTGLRLPCYIVAADKTKVTNIELIHITQGELDSALVGVQYGVKRILELKQSLLPSPLRRGAGGEVEPPHRCGKCNYCKQTKVITAPVSMNSLIA